MKFQTSIFYSSIVLYVLQTLSSFYIQAHAHAQDCSQQTLGAPQYSLLHGAHLAKELKSHCKADLTQRSGLEQSLVTCCCFLSATFESLCALKPTVWGFVKFWGIRQCGMSWNTLNIVYIKNFICCCPSSVHLSLYSYIVCFSGPQTILPWISGKHLGSMIN